MASFDRELVLPADLDRRGIRKFVINQFLDEEAGNGKSDLSTKYIYTVERLTNSNIVLKRPAFLNKGMDFTVHVVGKKFREKYGTKDQPSHQEIINELIYLKQQYPIEYLELSTIINEIYQCKSYEPTKLRNLNLFSHILSAEELALTIKWLFIEQDVTYWNWSGRHMLYQALKNSDLI